jgi:D-alanyl-D-alanine carboxypeptidase/D-alanyl-D-alanine-endopeptidase (penicillin-binding protein 4)
VTSLMADQGLVSDDGLSRYPDPAAAAASDFAQLLENEGIRIRGDVRPARASAVGEPIAGVLSPPVADLVEWMLRTSDNQLAEALGRLAAIERQLPGSFSGAVGAMGVAADSAGVAVDVDRLYDASGLSRDDRITAAALAHVLGLAAVDPALRPITLGLPVAGFDGTLADRYQELPQRQAAGLVRAKTGTLTGIVAEAGMAVGCDGNLTVFAFIADMVPDTEPARSTLDKATATLTTCP